MAVDKEKNTQVLVTFPNELLTQVEKYWHEQELKNRNEAIRELISIGLKQAKPSQD
ncbi:ribbon-helix-helix domain-containing protein [Paenibacillus sp. TRM 82003]|nr:ribbon-helix-helix domain-containing protein [Paenibacillus sp. TRM 82003]